MGKERAEFLPIKEKISTPYPFITIGDLDVMVERISPIFSKDKRIKKFQADLLELQKKYAPEGSTFYYIAQRELIAGIETKVKKHEKKTQGNKGIINFDRYIFPDRVDENHLRLELSRGADNQLVARPGSKWDKTEQINQLKKWLQTGNFSEIILVDDVVAFATTFPPIVEVIRSILPGVEITVVSGICSTGGEWAGKEKLESLGITVDSVVTATASAAIQGGSTGMAVPDSRDSTIFGGKVGSVGSQAMSYPYFYPFSVPTTSLMRAEAREEASLEWIQFNIGLVKYMNEKLGRKLTFSDLDVKGFGFPGTSVESFKKSLPVPEKKDSVLEYLNFIALVTPHLLQGQTNKTR